MPKSKRFYELVKRILDCLASILAMIILSPIWIAIALLVKLDSSGPILFKQARVGMGHKPFNMYKFRTMVKSAEEERDNIRHLAEASGPVFKIKGDPRTTQTGKFLRRFSLDELPQLLNVLKGHMSLVGPRPLLVTDINHPVTPAAGEVDEVQYALWQRRRLEVRPGIAGLWQVRGRNELPLEGWIKHDLDYVENCSLWLDLKILLKTIPVVLLGKGAY